MNARSKNKLAAWLFMQWATGKDAMNKAVAAGKYADPVRKSVFDSTFKDQLKDQPGYLDAFEKVIGSSKIQFTPQTQFFGTTEEWAGALQDIYGGQDAKGRLDQLAKANTTAVNS
jgi:multiple sugar transport system substrate-binding protein